jgi:hypothetical protein
MKREATVFALLGVAAVGFTAAMMMDPKCDRGCKNNLQHLLEHELKFFLSGGRWW